jgi:hypothetical protein
MTGREFDFSLKIVLVGGSGVGRRCILRNIFDPGPQRTLEVEPVTKLVDTGHHRV